jgi:glycosyltransferase involved in cell wall biosynthesis
MNYGILATCIIPTCGKSNVLLSLLNELEKQSKKHPNLYEIIVVGDNFNPPVTSTSTKFVVSQGQGVSAARNYGAKLATSPWLIFLDDDVVPNSLWAGILEIFFKTTDCDLAGGRLDIHPLMYQDVLPQKYRYLLGEKSGLNCRLGKFDYIAGAHMFIKKSIYEELGGFCETMGHFNGQLCLNEDVMLQVLYRKKYGRRILYLDELRCNHYIRPEQTKSGYIISRLQEQGKADLTIDKERYPGRYLFKYIYYNLFCLINHQNSNLLSVSSCDWYRRKSYLRGHC